MTKLRRSTGVAIVAVAAVAVLLGARAVASRRAEARAAVSTAARSTSADADPEARFETVRDRLVARLSEAEVLADATTAAWGRQTSAANYNLQLAGLTADWRYYEAAERFTQRAFDASHARWAGEPRGAALVRGELDYALHRFGRVITDLEPLYAEAALGGNDDLMAQAKALEGATRVALGEYDKGQALLREAVALDPDRSSHAQRLAVALVKTGDFDEALQIFTKAEGFSPNPRGRAWAALQRGLVEMERGRYSVARAHLERASRTFQGFWLVDEHLAELDVAEGKPAEAEARYRSLIERTADPEHMDALAELVRAPAPAEAKALRARARAVHVERLARFPEAAAGHAVEHYVKFEADVARAVELAEQNRAVRPDGEARAHLAQAYLRAGRVSDASAEMKQVLATRWISAESLATAAVAFRRTGDRPAADAAREKALAHNPHAMADIARLDSLVSAE